MNFFHEMFSIIWTNQLLVLKKFLYHGLDIFWWVYGLLNVHFINHSNGVPFLKCMLLGNGDNYTRCHSRCTYTICWLLLIACYNDYDSHTVMGYTSAYSTMPTEPFMKTVKRLCKQSQCHNIMEKEVRTVHIYILVYFNDLFIDIEMKVGCFNWWM